MRNYLIFLTVTIITIIAFSCEKDIDEQDYPDLINPFDSINSFFVQAERIAGDGCSLYLISGVQDNTTASLNYDLNWKYYFINGKRIITFEIIQGKTKVTDKIIQELPMGHEHIYKNDDRLKSILSPKIIWDKCINKYEKPILNIDIYVPLIFPKSNFIYSLYSKEGYNQLGLDYFIFDANTGNDITFE